MKIAFSVNMMVCLHHVCMPYKTSVEIMLDRRTNCARNSTKPSPKNLACVETDCIKPYDSTNARRSMRMKYHIAQLRRMVTEQEDVTVGFLCGAGAETLIFVTGTSGKYRSFSAPGRKTKVSCGYPENQEKSKCLGIRC